MINSIQDCKTLNNGIKMPWLGFGVFKVPEGEIVENAVKLALQAGYRHIDTAALYGNERGVGKAIRESGVRREDIFLTTKVWNDDQRKQRITEALESSLKKLETDYVDLYLVHWPVKGFYQKTWKIMEEIYKSGRAKAIGVSNFLVHQLDDILADCQIVPAVNQVEFHPYLLQPELLKFCQSKNIQLEAWAPLMQGRFVILQDIKQMANKYHKSAAQILLRWDLQHQVVTIPKSTHLERITENANIFDFELSAEDMLKIDQLDKDERIGPHPDYVDF
jgi:methylglyoxal/glyoxal reductase